MGTVTQRHVGALGRSFNVVGHLRVRDRVELQAACRGAGGVTAHRDARRAGAPPPALKVLARRCAVPVELAVDVPARLPEPVEVAAYYVVSEALANVTKHARATVAHVEVLARDGRLHLSVRDDGVGGAAVGAARGWSGSPTGSRRWTAQSASPARPGRGRRCRSTSPPRRSQGRRGGEAPREAAEPRLPVHPPLRVSVMLFGRGRDPARQQPVEVLSGTAPRSPFRTAFTPARVSAAYRTAASAAHPDAAWRWGRCPGPRGGVVVGGVGRTG
jgi:hypothetical protein